MMYLHPQNLISVYKVQNNSLLAMAIKHNGFSVWTCTVYGLFKIRIRVTLLHLSYLLKRAAHCMRNTDI